jgi:hypothetical protein
MTDEKVKKSRRPFWALFPKTGVRIYTLPENPKKYLSSDMTPLWPFVYGPKTMAGYLSFDLTCICHDRCDR